MFTQVKHANCEEFYVLRYYATQYVESQLTFQMSAPSSESKSKSADYFMLVSCLAYSSILKRM
jgi:hypothetical protein